MNDPYMQGGDDLSDPISLSGVSPMRYMARGGFVVPPQLPVVYRPEDRKYLEARQAEAEAYDAQRTAYNTALEKYKTEVYNPYESQLKVFNAAAEAYNRDVYGPYQAAYKTYEEAVNAFNAGPMETEYAGPAEPTLTPFSMTAPVAPAAFSMTAPTAPFKEEEVAARQAQAAEAAQQDAASRRFAFEAINDLGEYNLAGMSQGSGIAGLSVPGYVKGGPVFAKAPGVLSAKQMLRKLGNKTKKFANGGAVKSPTLAEQIAALQKSISSMPEVIPTGPSRLGNRQMEPNPSLLAARQELDKLVAQQRSQAAAVPVITPAPIGVTTPTTPTPTTAKTDLTELSKPVVVSTPPASGNAAGEAGSVIAATPSVFRGARPITALPVVPGSAPAVQKPISATTPAPGSAKSDLAEISKPGPSIPEVGALPIKEFMPPGSPQIAPPVVQPPGGGAGTPMTSQELGKFVLEMAVKKTKPDLMWDANQDGRISAADALQVAKGWRPKDYGQQPISTPSPKTYPPEFVGPLPEGAKREPSTMPNVPGIPDFPPVITPPGGNVTILPRPMPPGQSLPPVSPTPPRTPVTPQPVVPVPQVPTMPRTPPLFRPPPPRSMPGTLPMPFNPFQINQGPTALDLLQRSPNLSPMTLGGQGNLGFMKDRLGNVIQTPGMPPPVRTFADGGIASRTAALNAYNLSDEEDEPILTDPVGTASQMLRELNPQTQMEYEATPKKVSMKRVSKTPMESASGTARGMKMELEEISAMKMPKDAKRRSSLSKAEFEDLAREYGLKRDAALSSARGLMSETFGKPTLEKPSLTKRGLTKRRFEEGGEVKKFEGESLQSPEEQPVVEESSASRALKEFVRPVREGVQGYFGLDSQGAGSEAYRTGQALSNMPGAGAPATLGIFIGKSSKLWNKAMNEAARKMEKAGAPAEEIWQKTGNFKGPDDQWRQEISDLGATQRTQVSQGPASMVFQHPELYQNYPDMKDVFIRTDPYAVRSSYSGAGVPGAEEINLGTAGGKVENVRGLLHEMQHGIQFREGFGLGGSKITAFNDPKAFEILEMVRKRVSTPATLEEFAKGAYQTTKITPKIEDEYKNLYLKNYAASLKSGGLDRMAQEEASRIYYNRLLGETEARAVEDRRMFTPEQRLEVFPTKSYKVDGKPVALEDLIVKRPMERANGGPVNKHDAFIKARA